MTILRTIPESEAEGRVAEWYAADRASLGHVATHTSAMALNPDAVDAFEDLLRSTLDSLGVRRYELITLAAARAIGSGSCLLAHGRKSLTLFERDQLLRIARDHRNAGLDPAEVAMMDFAARLSTDSASMTSDDAATLRAHGFTDRQIIDIAIAAGARNFYSRTLHALGVAVDVPPDLDPELRAALWDGAERLSESSRTG